MTLHEFAVIEKFFKIIARSGDGVVLGPGDDCALLSVPPGHELCVSTDTLIEGVHFPPRSAAALVAQRTVAANLSDLAAMGAMPFACLLAMTLPSADETWLAAFSKRLSSLLDAAGLPLVGGNLSRSAPISLTMTVMGTVPAGSAVRRTGARQGDGIFVTGTLGDAREGLGRLLAGDRDGYLAERYANPPSRITVGARLRDLASAMIDLSDGLAGDIVHIMECSEVGAEIRMDSLPLSDALIAQVGQQQAARMALFGGDDYELCFTAPMSRADAIQAIATETRTPITRIGRVTGERLRVIDLQGDPVEDLAGYQHF